MDLNKVCFGNYLRRGFTVFACKKCLLRKLFMESFFVFVRKYLMILLVALDVLFNFNLLSEIVKGVPIA